MVDIPSIILKAKQLKTDEHALREILKEYIRTASKTYGLKTISKITELQYSNMPKDLAENSKRLGIERLAEAAERVYLSIQDGILK